MIPAGVDWTAFAVFLFFTVAVCGIGFVAAYRKTTSGPASLSQWGLGGRQFGVLFTLFLVGGDFYTAYTVIAVPALVYATGAYGFFALPFTIIVYPFFFAVMPRLWTICKQRDYVTAADFVQGRYGSRWLALAVAVTSLLATIPYIALQLIGMQVVIAALGLGTGDAPLFVAFVLLAVYTYHSGLKAPAMLAFGKAVMIFLVIAVAVIWIPLKLGGYGAIFAAADAAFAGRKGAGLLLSGPQQLPYATMALGSALAGFMYPHALTGVLGSSSARTIRLNAVLLPVFTILLGLIALLGYMALAAGIHAGNSSFIVPLLFVRMFPSWFVGFSFAAIVIGALVPAAIMAIASAAIGTRNIGKAVFFPDMAPATESKWAKRISVVVLFLALCFVIFLPTQYATDLQLIGGIWISQIFPAVVLGLLRMRLHTSALLIGWLAGMIVGTWLTIDTGLKPVIALSVAGHACSLYIGILTLALNLALTLLGSWWLNVTGKASASWAILTEASPPSCP